METTGACVVSCRDVTKRYDATLALDRFSLDVRAGQVFALLGENGAGKTTLMRLILGLHWPDDGDVRVFGKHLSSDREGLLARIGSLIELPSFYPHLTGRENVEIVRRLRSLPAAETDRVLDLVGLRDVSHRKAAGYSQGMKQRLAIATAVLGSPELIILDEPTNGLDPNGIREVRELITGLPVRTGATVLVSSHLLAEVEQIADRVAIVQRGSLLFEGTLEELTVREPPRVSIATPETERAFDLLTGEGIQVAHDDRRLVISCSRDRIPEINRMLVEAGIPVQEITHRRPSLEQLYFNLTRPTAQLTWAPNVAAFLRALRVEAAKLRRARVLVSALMVPLGFVALKGVGFAVRGAAGLGVERYSYGYFISIGQFFWERLLVPLLAVAVCSWLVWLEDDSGHWKVLLTQPIPRGAFYLSKLSIAFALVFLLQTFWWLSHGLCGYGLRLGGGAALWSAGAHALLVAVGLAPLICVQLWLSVQLRSPFTALGIGVAGNAAALVLAGTSINHWHPWGLAQIAGEPAAAPWTLWTALGTAGVMAWAGVFCFARKAF